MRFFRIYQAITKTRILSMYQVSLWERFVAFGSRPGGKRRRWKRVPTHANGAVLQGGMKMRLLLVGGLLALAGCGGGGTTGTNYSDPPPMAEIVATPSPKASETPEAPAAAEESAPDNVAEPAADNAVDAEAVANGTA
jgi:hypothetical protein